MPSLGFLSLLPAVLAMAVAYILFQQPEMLVVSGPDPAPGHCPASPNDAVALGRFTQLLRFATVSNASQPYSLQDVTQFDGMLAFMAEAYAPLWAHLDIEAVGPGGYSRMLTWRGTDSSLRPVLLVSHYDVVPVHRPGDWSHPPFSGTVADGYIYGRGTLDIKYSVAALMEAASELAASGHRPTRTLIFSFGQDEECGGLGATAAAELLASRGVHLEVVVDEGGAIMWDGLAPLVSTPVAVVGTAEKGFEQVEVLFRSVGGHSSAPPLDGSDIAAQAARFIQYMQAHPFPAEMLTPTAGMLQVLGAITPRVWLRPLLERAANWPLSWALAQGLARASPETAAMVRTTAAVTWMTAGVADNVLPQQGTVSVNVRLAPGATRESVLQYVQDAITAVKVDAVVSAVSSHPAPAANVTSATGVYFRLLKQSIQELWQHNGKAIAVSPYMLSGMTDSRHFAPLSEHGVLRFVPFAINKAEMRGIHGTNERVPVDSFKRAICTYKRLLQLLSMQGSSQA